MLLSGVPTSRESKELELSEIVTKENAIPAMELKDYFEVRTWTRTTDNASQLVNGVCVYSYGAYCTLQSFKSCLAGSDSSASHTSSCDLVTLDKRGEVQLELSLAVVIFAKVLKPTYQFKLQPVALGEMDVVLAQVRDQDEAIRDLRDELDELRDQLEALTPPAAATTTTAPAVPNSVVFLRAVTTHAAGMNQMLTWHATDVGGAFSVDGDRITVYQSGVYCVQVVVHHTNSYDPNAGTLFFRPPQTAAFQLHRNGIVVALAHGSSVKGTAQSTALHHVLPLNQFDVLKVHYTGTNHAKESSYIVVYMLK